MKGKKGFGKILDVSKGPVGSAMKGTAVGAWINYLDGKFLNGTLQSLRIGSSQKGMNLSASDALTVLLVQGKSALKGKNLMDTAAIIAGKKAGEITGAIDPYEVTVQGGMPKVSYSAKTGGLNS